MFKKLFSALLVLTLLFTPVGGFMLGDQLTTVHAKGYKSGKKSFNSNTNNSPSLFKKDDTQQKSSTTTKSSTTAKSKTGSIMKGLFLGGLAGLLLGGLLSNLGILGSIIGLFINVLAILAIILIIRKLFAYFKNKRKSEDDTIWGK
jgi:beta-lactamase regulating signal transducer with metallopeptidase domain